MIAVLTMGKFRVGVVSRKGIIASKGETWFKEKFLHVLTPVTIIALLITLVLLFSFKGEVILSNPMTIVWIAIPLFLQTCLIFVLGYVLAKWMKLKYSDAAPSAMIGASNHFEVAIATATMLFGLSSGAALATSHFLRWCSSVWTGNPISRQLPSLWGRSDGTSDVSAMRSSVLIASSLSMCPMSTWSLAIPHQVWPRACAFALLGASCRIL